MMRELCARNGLALPPSSTGIASALQHALRVFVIYNAANVGTMVSDLEGEMARINAGITFTLNQEEIATVNQVLVLLTRGVLSGVSLGQLEEVLQLDKAPSLHHHRTFSVSACAVPSLSPFHLFPAPPVGCGSRSSRVRIQ